MLFVAVSPTVASAHGVVAASGPVGSATADVAAGASHTCALADGAVTCWGDNTLGQLGDGTTNDSLVPVEVTGLGHGVQAVVAGTGYSCAIVNGGVQCWGNASLVPTPVSGLESGVQAIAAGAQHTCALVDGTVWCWGDNASGQLGDGTTVDRATPVQVGIVGGVRALAAGAAHTCALVNDGVRCWGDNTWGQLGDGTTSNSAVPVSVGAFVPTTPIPGKIYRAQALTAGGGHTCALVNEGVWCWGYNAIGQLGDGTQINRSTPVQTTAAGSGVTSFAAGYLQTCAAMYNGVKCWGALSVNAMGNITTWSATAVWIYGTNTGSAPNAFAIAAGGLHTCIVGMVAGGISPASYGVFCWGSNSSGELGDGTTTSTTTTVKVAALTVGVQALAAGTTHSCAIVSGAVWCWGANTSGQLGDGTLLVRTAPVAVSGSLAARAITVGSEHSCMIDESDRVMCWGQGANGQLGNNSPLNRSTPVQVLDLPNTVQAVAAGDRHTCAVADGSVYCWGWNTEGQLGIGNTSTRLKAVRVSVLPVGGVQAIAAATYHTCAIVGGGVWCWGRNAEGALGNGTTTRSLVPTQVSNIAGGVQGIAAGSAQTFLPERQSHTCALIDGGVQCWGSNGSGQLGNASITVQSTIPVPVPGLGSGVQAIATAGLNSCALVDGTAQCWGASTHGQLGNGATVGSMTLSSPTLVETKSMTPVVPTDLPTDVQAIVPGTNRTCAVVNGGILCWGFNGALYTLGNASSTFTSTVPVPVSGFARGVWGVAAGNLHSCALVNGGVQCWGYNVDGQLGDDSNDWSFTPRQVVGLTSHVRSIASGPDHVCAVVDGAMKCWGNNGSGQLGDGTSISRSAPVTVIPSGVEAIATGDMHTCAIWNGGVRCWGDNAGGQLGFTGASIDAPPPASIPMNGVFPRVQAIAAGSLHSCAIVEGGVQCWGDNASGQLGDGSTNDSSAPVLVSGLASGVVGIAARGERTCALSSAGAVRCWGGGVTSPTLVNGFSSGVHAIAAGYAHACAVVDTGIACWGDNAGGQLGNGTNTASASPVAVLGLTTGIPMSVQPIFRSIVPAAGDSHSCGVVNDTVRCWGDNPTGQLGDGTDVPSNVAVQVGPLL